jgi:hypothetical protein
MLRAAKLYLSSIVKVFRAICTNINKCSFDFLPLFGSVLGFVVQKLHRLRVVIEALKKIGE